MTVDTDARNAAAEGAAVVLVVAGAATVARVVGAAGVVGVVVAPRVDVLPLGASVVGAAGAVDGCDDDPHAARAAASSTTSRAGATLRVDARGPCTFLTLSVVHRNLAAAIAPCVMLLAGCGSSAAHPDSSAPATTRPAATSTSSGASTATPRSVPALAASTTPTTSATTTSAAPPRTTVRPTTTSPPAVTGQLIVVDATAYGRSSATLTAYDETTTGLVRRFGPWTARIGRNGFAPPGAKREGDGRAPSGTYGFSFFFGIEPDPGVAFPYRRIDSTALVWDDDPSSANYNEWIDTRVASAGVHPEPMYDAPFYDYGAVIAYNTARTPGLGSAIFLHVSNGDSTAGCVALPVGELLPVLRWLNPNAHPQIRMGVGVAAS